MYLYSKKTKRLYRRENVTIPRQISLPMSGKLKNVEFLKIY